VYVTPVAPEPEASIDQSGFVRLVPVMEAAPEVPVSTGLPLLVAICEV
jgi:hypothetical protein